MLPRSRFEPGTILWLPHERRLPYNTLDLSDTVPDDCFGRPVLFLATNPSDDAAWILILTTFGDLGPSNAYLRRYGHSAGEYLPLHPAPRRFAIPELFLKEPQSLVHKNWVFASEPYRCPKVWLEEARDDRWSNPQLSEDSRKIKEGSFDDLVRYARANGWHSGVYSGLLRHRGRSSGNVRQEDERTSLLPHDDGPMNGVGSGAVGSSRKRRESRKRRGGWFCLCYWLGVHQGLSRK